MKRVVHCYSGGLDSTVLLYDLVKGGAKVNCLAVEYGQRHQRELGFAKKHCEALEVPLEVLVIPTLQGSRLTDSGESWVVPFRNPILLALAVNWAAALGFETVTIACNADDEADFPDCRWEVVDAVNHAAKLARVPVQIEAPYLRVTKREIVKRGRELGVALEETWSCYEGAAEPCGKCPACRKRAEALA